MNVPRECTFLKYVLSTYIHISGKVCTSSCLGKKYVLLHVLNQVGPEQDILSTSRYILGIKNSLSSESLFQVQMGH
jgi:hypothetical protein